MNYNLESIGLQILLVYSIGFGAIAQVLAGRKTTNWLWLIGAIAWFVGGLVASEVIVGTMTVDEIQPIIGGLAYDEALLGGLVVGLIAVAATWFATRTRESERPVDGRTTAMPLPR